MNVDIKDRREDVEMFRMACNMSELGISYIQADLIIKLQYAIQQKGDDFSIKDATKIFHKWKDGWQSYFEKKESNQHVPEVGKKV